MRILQINVNGQSGSTGKIVNDINKVLLAKGHKCLICYGANDQIENEHFKRITPEFERRFNAAVSHITGIRHGGFTPFSYFRFKNIVRQWQPDIVHVHCPNGYIIDLFKMLKFLATNNIKTVLTNHAEYFYTGGCGYAFNCDKFKKRCLKCKIQQRKIGIDTADYEWRHFKAAFDLFKPENILITSVSPWVKQRAMEAPAMKRFEHQVVMNGVDTEIFRTRVISQNVRNRLPHKGPIALHVTASFSMAPDDIKGGYWIVELASQMPEMTFVVASTYTHISETLPSNILLWGRTKDQIELAELYNSADVTVITSVRETFSMVVAESLCCGTPLVGFKAGGPESIALPNYTHFVKQGDIQELHNQIKFSLKKQYSRKEVSRSAINYYSKESMSEEYIKLYHRLTSTVI